MLNLEQFSINSCFDEAVKRTLEADVLFMDFEVSYTHAFFDQVKELAGSSAILKHHLMNHGAVHTWETSEGWPYKPQWQLGFYIEPKFFFFISNVEPYKKKSQEFLDRIRKSLTQTKIMVGQNFKYDLSILAQIMELKEEELLLTRVHDLMTMGYSLDMSQKKFNLGVTAKRFLETIGDGDKKYFEIDGELVECDWKQSEEFHRTPIDQRFWETIKYNREDLLITKEVYFAILKQMRRENVTRSLHIYDWFIPFYTLLEMNGLDVDVNQAEDAFFSSAQDGQQIQYDVAVLMMRLLDEMRGTEAQASFTKKIKKSAETEEAFEQKFGFFDLESFKLKYGNGAVRKKKIMQLEPSKNQLCLNMVSGSNFRELISMLLADGYGYQISKTPSGSYGFQKDEIGRFVTRLSVSTDPLELIIYELLDKMLQINSLKANLARVKAFYLLPAKIYPDGRLHSEYKLLGTETGRISSVRPGIMNLPFRIKKLIKGKKKFVQIDLRSAEAKLFMLITQNKEILAELLVNDDTYSVIGMRVFELTEMSKKTRPVERNIMKIGVLAKMYGQNINGLAEQVKIFYDPVRWEIYQEKEKYHFLYKWECVSITDENFAESVDKQLVQATEAATEVLKTSKVVDDSGAPYSLGSVFYLSDEDRAKKFPTTENASLTKVLELRQKLDDLVGLDYFQIASISDRRLEETIDSGKYEDWVCKTFFKLDDPESSFVMSPVGLIRRHDMSKYGLIREDLTPMQRDAVYKLVKLAYKAFFLDLQTFDGQFYNNGEFVFVECRRLHAFSAFDKVFAIPDKRSYNGKTKQVPSSLVSKMADKLGSEEYFDDIMRVLLDPEMRFSFRRACARLAARYRESLNFPIQGPSSFINSYIGYMSYRKCLSNEIDAKVVNTVHDAVHFDLGDESQVPKFSELVTEVYDDMELLTHILSDGLRSIHPELDEFSFIPIGGDIEVVDTLDQAK